MQTKSNTTFLEPSGNGPSPEEKAAAWKKNTLNSIYSQMKQEKKRGNPKDFVFLSNRNTIVDYRGGCRVEAKFPEKIPQGAYVYTQTSPGPSGLTAVQVVDDLPEAQKTVVKHAEGRVEVLPREALFPTPIPAEPTMVHKQHLHLYVGETLASRYWSRTARMRVNRP